jgi:hypothetical protein
LSLLDDWLPAYDFSERHTIVCRADRARVWTALYEADLADSRIVHALLAIRGLGTRPRLSLGALIEGGFSVLGEEPEREIVMGFAGRFWTPSGGRIRVDAAEFRGPIPAGTARAAWSFRAEPRADGSTELVTETRIACADAASRRRFRAYWLFVRPGSGLIRRFMLRAVRARAERAGP